MSKISVVMGVYNGGKYLNAAINSILNQTFKNIQFVIVDDGSTDETYDILNSFNDNRITIIRNERNIGLTRSLNKAISNSQGEYIARQDADDLSHPDRLQKQLSFLKSNPSFAMIGTQAILIDKDDSKIADIKVASDVAVIKSSLPKANQFVHGSVLMRRSVLNEIGAYREEFRYAQDYDLWLRMLEYKITNMPDQLYSLRRLGSSISLKNYDRQLLFAFLARAFYVEREHDLTDSYNKLSVMDPEKLLFECFSDLKISYEIEKFGICMQLAIESAENKNLKNYLYWMRSAYKNAPTKIHRSEVIQKFYKRLLKPFVYNYNRYIGWRF